MFAIQFGLSTPSKVNSSSLDLKKTTKIVPNENPSQCVTFITSERCYYAT